MSKSKTYFDIAGIIAAVIGFLVVFNNFIIGAIVLTLGVMLLVISSKNDYEYYKKNKTKLIIIGIAFIIICPISAIFVFIGIDKFSNVNGANAPPLDNKVVKERVKVSKEVRRIDMLLKLGVLMVAISGLLFATTRWSIIGDLPKSLALCIMGVLFIFLYRFTKIKLKLTTSSNTYWVLGMLFFIFTFISIGYFGILGEWFSYSGGASYLVYSITCFIVALTSFITVRKIGFNKLIYITYISLYISLFLILKFCFIDKALICFVLELITFFTLVIMDKDRGHSLYKFSKFISYFYIILIISTLNCNMSIPSSLMGILLLIYILVNERTRIINLLIPVLANIILAVGVFELSLGTINNYIYLVLVTVLYLVILSIKDKPRVVSIINDIVYTIAICMFMCSLYTDNLIFPMFVTSTIYLVLSVILSSRLLKLDNSFLASYMPIIGILMFVNCGVRILNEIFNVGSIEYILLVIAYIVARRVVVEDSKKKLYTIAIAIFTYFSFLAGFTEGIIPVVAADIGLIYLMIKYKDERKVFSNINYGLFLVNLSVLFVNNNLLKLSDYFSVLVVIWIYLILIYVLKDERKKRLTNILLVLPFGQLISSLEYLIDNEFIVIMTNLLSLYIVYLILRYLVKNEKRYNIVATIGVIISMLEIIFVRGTFVGIYIGIVGVAIMILGYSKKNFSALFRVGLIITLFNIIFQLGELWSRIPFWLYLLVVGLGLIVFVTFKEMKKMSEGDKKE